MISLYQNRGHRQLQNLDSQHINLLKIGCHFGILKLACYFDPIGKRFHLGFNQSRMRTQLASDVSFSTKMLQLCVCYRGFYSLEKKMACVLCPSKIGAHLKCIHIHIQCPSTQCVYMYVFIIHFPSNTYAQICTYVYIFTCVCVRACIMYMYIYIFTNT